MKLKPIKAVEPNYVSWQKGSKTSNINRRSKVTRVQLFEFGRRSSVARDWLSEFSRQSSVVGTPLTSSGVGVRASEFGHHVVLHILKVIIIDSKGLHHFLLGRHSTETCARFRDPVAQVQFSVFPKYFKRHF